MFCVHVLLLKTDSCFRLAGPGGYGGGGYWKHQHKMQPPGRPKRPHRPRRQRGQPGTRVGFCLISN